MHSETMILMTLFIKYTEYFSFTLYTHTTGGGGQVLFIDSRKGLERIERKKSQPNFHKNLGGGS